MSTVISVNQVSKQYRLGQVGTGTLSHDVNRWWHRIRGKEDPYLKVGEVNDRANRPVTSSGLDATSSQYAWALRDVSFEAKEGEVLGIVGRNGAGKSTLLKILSRVTKPTTGSIGVKGRVASLLEVGTGFHPELTGRENVFLNGAILGMRKDEIRRKFDEIVDFSGCERYIDTPVKRYSSGMYVRLAFAVAAHLEPEILIVDEVLAVGDVRFQKKCLEKMEMETQKGRTILFVSHQLNSVRLLCDRSIWIDQGEVKMIGKTLDVVNDYEKDAGTGRTVEESTYKKAKGVASFYDWSIVEPVSHRPNVLLTQEPVTVKFMVKIRQRVKNGYCGLDLFDTDNTRMWSTGVFELNLDPGNHAFVYKLEGIPLRPGPYYWRISLWEDEGMLDMWSGEPEMIIGTKPMTDIRDKLAGILNVPYEFSSSQID